MESTESFTVEHPKPARPALVALAAIVLSWLAEIAAQMDYFGPGGEISLWGVQTAVAQSAVIVAGLVVALALVGRMDLLTRAVTLLFLLMAVLNLALWTLYREAPQLYATETGVSLIRALSHLVQIGLLVWLLRAPLRQWLRAGLVMAVVFLGTKEIVLRWFSVDELYVFPDAEWAEDYTPVDVEALYDAQDRLMGEQVAALAPQTPGVTEVFALALGGTADQSVFLTEVDSVAGILDAQYGSGPRTLRLANSHDHPTRYPMANRANLARALKEIGARQGEEDLAILFLTSHGKEDIFSLDFAEAGTTDLTAAEFKAMLADGGIGPAMIVVSACFSGSFIDDIQAPDRLVITAAREDRTSFGCRDGAEWTEFGESFFDKALRADPDPRRAFPVAAEDVARKEVADELTPSLPQISEGAEIGAVLDRVLAR
ncbi:MAG: C13 family peptidase [Tabrizicola sp.]|uniref:C13 family peptidase n=1 Tax=Tabrizicola sp. TaxID=2005166 RepID=UPI002ABA6831|nr:C13 family peptidase [Tabrizicola sp.]MDZ4085668.1 C13 family peptidase [Tabrizicola sp.]